MYRPGHACQHEATPPRKREAAPRAVQVFCQILRHARKAGFLCPFLKGGYQAEGVAYEGATVLHANTGYYTEPIATLDFASLYPSIMMAHNLCYSTLVPSGDVGSVVPEEHVERSPGGACPPCPCIFLVLEVYWLGV